MTAWPDLLAALIRGDDLDASSTQWAMGQIMDGEATGVQIAGFAVALRAKGETSEEVDGMATAMLERARRLEIPAPAVDIVGTGGDRASTVNISTMAAVVARAAGCTVIKHGNRAASSACGAADLLEELGLRLDRDPDQVARSAEQVGIAFCFAPVFHPALRFASTARRELGIPTVFNFLGPLTNPAQPAAMAVGVADPRMAEVIAGVFARRGTSALVFRGDDGLDELTTTTSSTVWIVRDGTVSRRQLDPAGLGLPIAEPGALRGADAAFNADVARRLFGGEAGPVRDAVLLNAAAAIVAGAPDPERLDGQMAEAMTVAATAIDNGSAERVLEDWIRANA